VFGEIAAMTFVEALTQLCAKHHPDADLSPSVKAGKAADRASRVVFKKERGGVYAGRDADGTVVLVYFNDNANVIACTEIEPGDD
jgi:hypothetical protein